MKWSSENDKMKFDKMSSPIPMQIQYIQIYRNPQLLKAEGVPQSFYII